MAAANNDSVLYGLSRDGLSVITLPNTSSSCVHPAYDVTNSVTILTLVGRGGGGAGSGRPDKGIQLKVTSDILP